MITAQGLAETVAGHKSAKKTADNGTHECGEPKRQEVSAGAKEKLGDTPTYDTAGASAECASE